MTTPYDDDHDEQPTEREQPSWRRKLEADAKAGREAQAAAEAAKSEATAARRELAFTKLGIDTERGTGALFAKAYDGEATLDAIKAEAEKYGLLAPAGTQVPEAEQRAAERISMAAVGGVPAGGAAHDFEGELDSIPMLVRGEGGHLEQNPEYVQRVLEATRAQATREGREFVLSAGQVKAQSGYSLGPATRPLQS